MSIQQEDERDADGDLTPKALAARKKLKKDIKTSTTKKLSKDRKESRQKAKKQEITQENAEEKKALLQKVAKVADNKTNIVTPDVKEEIDDYYTDLLAGREIGWRPFEGPQTQFMEADEFEVLFSGGRAPGKSDALMMDAVRYCEYKEFRGLVIRKAMSELRDLINRAKDLYPQIYPGTKWKEQEKLFIFPSGARIEFGYCDHAEDVEQYKGQEYSWLGIDELTEIPQEETYERLIASVRKKGKGFKTYVRATTNPNGVGKNWVKKRFVDQGPVNSTLKLSTHIEQLDKTITTTRKWIHGTVFDNPKIVAENPEYIAMLKNIDNAVLRKQWLEGDWDSSDGLAFDEFNRNVHVIKPFQVPADWYRFRACDWGFKTKASCLWMAVSPERDIYVYRELLTGGNTPNGQKTAIEFGREVLRIEQEAGENVRYGVLDASAWSQRGEDSPSPAELMIAQGVSWRPSDRTKHSRITGKLEVHRYLQIHEETERPSVFFFDTCTDLISCMSSLPMDKNNNEDVDTKADDHSYDALRYGLMTRPMAYNNYHWNLQTEQKPVIGNAHFGY